MATTFFKPIPCPIPPFVLSGITLLVITIPGVVRFRTDNTKSLSLRCNLIWMHGLAIFSDASIALSTRFPSSTNKSLEEIGHSDKSQSEKSTGIDFFCASLYFWLRSVSIIGLPVLTTSVFIWISVELLRIRSNADAVSPCSSKPAIVFS